MNVQAQLDSLRQEFPACGTMAFADLASGLVLCVSASRRPPQEQLDRTCRMAQDMLDGQPGTAAGAALAEGDGGGARPDLALLQTRDDLRVFLRAPDVPTDALCCICSPGVDIETLIARARAWLAGIGSA